MPINVSGGHTGNFVLSNDGSRLYMAGPDGVLRTYDVATGDLIDSAAIGHDLGAIAISPDGSFLLITEQQPVSFVESESDWTHNRTTSGICKVDLASGDSVRINYTSFGYNYVLADVEITSAGTALFTQNILPGWSGSTPIVTLDLASGTFSASPPHYYQAGSLTAAPDGATVLWGELQLSSAEAFVFSSAAAPLSVAGVYEDGVYGFAQGVEAYSGAGDDGRVAIFTGGQLHLWDGDLDYLQSLTALNSELGVIVGLQFSADGRTLFALASETDQIYAIDLADYSIVGTMPVDADVASVLKWGDEIVAAPDESFLLVSTSTGVVRVDTFVVTGTAAGEIYEGRSFHDQYTGLGGDDSIFGLVGHDNLDGGSGDDLIEGGVGNDVLIGGLGADTMRGGLGDDLFFVDNAGDLAEENAAEGIDEVRTSLARYTLVGTNIENLTGLGTVDQTFFGNDTANRISGGAGADSMRGGLGDDTYVIDNSGDRALEFSGQGTDTVETSVAHTLLANVENLVFTGTANVNGAGNALDNVIDGNAGRNLINGLGGADTMRGGLGHDIYIVDNAGDQVVEVAGGGTDSVQSSVTFTLGDDVERLYLTGVGNIDGFGNALANTINGNGGANRLDGGAGADRMLGGSGNDTYVVDNAADLAIESSAAGGIDTVESSIALTLLANLENLVLTGSANINAAGNSLANSLTGNSGNNLLNGFGSADSMHGGDGNDVYIVDNVGDQALETSATGGDDRVQSSVSLSLTSFVEQLTLTGSASINGTGNALDNVINGNNGANNLGGLSGNDTLRGGAGADALHGGTGNDTLDGGANADGFYFETALDAATNVDTILGYVAADDTIFLDNAVFTGLADGALAAGAFNSGTAATEADDRIIYNAATGALLFDADGAGGAAAVQFATVTAGLVMTASEFTVI